MLSAPLLSPQRFPQPASLCRRSARDGGGGEQLHRLNYRRVIPLQQAAEQRFSSQTGAVTAMASHGAESARVPQQCHGRHAALLVEPVDGGPLTSPAGESDSTKALRQTVLDVPVSELANGCELVMAVLLDKASRTVLLEVPNALGWRLHFGVVARQPDKAVCIEEDGRWAAATEAAAAGLDAAGVPLLSQLCPAGVMLFTFGNGHAPMRVRVLQAACRPEGAPVGSVYSFDDVPYQRMWAGKHSSDCHRPCCSQYDNFLRRRKGEA